MYEENFLCFILLPNHGWLDTYVFNIDHHLSKRTIPKVIHKVIG